ncbi:MAG TPA: hypothetical protein VIJ23_00600 [Mycobacterium sp.]
MGNDDGGRVGVGGGHRRLGDPVQRVHRVGRQQPVGEVAGRGEPPSALLGLGEQPGVGDRRAGRRGQRGDQLFIVGGEHTTGARSQMELAEHLIAHPDRHVQEAAHRWVTGCETSRRWLGGRLDTCVGYGLCGQQLPDPPRGGQPADPGDQVLVHSRLDELLQLPVAAVHPDRGVPGSQQITGGVDDMAQQHRQAQIRGDRGVRAQQPPQPPLRGQHVLGPVPQLFEQLIQLQPGDIGELQPLNNTRGVLAAWRFTRRPRRGSRPRWGSIVRRHRRPVNQVAVL